MRLDIDSENEQNREIVGHPLRLSSQDRFSREEDKVSDLVLEYIQSQLEDDQIVDTTTTTCW